MPVVKMMRSAVYGGEARAVGAIVELSERDAVLAVSYGDAVEVVATATPPDVIEHREPVVQSRDPDVQPRRRAR